VTIAQFPHCDQRVLHAPGECEFCDDHTEWQELRKAWGIVLTGHLAGEGLPCLADAARPAGSQFSLVNATFAIAATSIPWADSSTICARRQVTYQILDAAVRGWFVEVCSFYGRACGDKPLETHEQTPQRVKLFSCLAAVPLLPSW
jgi:hypothetical protein